MTTRDATFALARVVGALYQLRRGYEAQRQERVALCAAHEPLDVLRDDIAEDLFVDLIIHALKQKRGDDGDDDDDDEKYNYVGLEGGGAGA